MKTIDEVLNKNLSGLYYGNRVILPFTGTVLKLIIENDVIMDFSPSSKHVNINETEDYLEIYFKDYKNLKDVVHKYEVIKLIIVEKGKDIFNLENHRKIALRIEDNHNLKIEKLDEDILFIE